MKKILTIMLICICIMGISACRNQEISDEIQEKDLQTESNITEEDYKENPSEISANENVANESVYTDMLDKRRVIQEQSFHVELNGWGEVNFVSYLPWENETFEDVSFLLVKDDAIVYNFPYYCENNSTEHYIGLFDSVAAVGFRDINKDDLQDVIVIINYVTGAGPQGMMPRPTARIFLADEDGFYLATDLMDEIADNVEENDLSIESICEYLEK